MEYPRQITVIQAAAIITSTIIGVGVLALPYFAAGHAGTASPLITLAAILLSFFGLWFISVLGMRFRTQSIVEYSEAILGRWLAFAGNLLIILFFAALTSLAAREFGEVVITAVLKRTPLEVVVAIMLLIAMISCRKDITTFAYIHHFYLPIIVFPAIVIVALSLRNAKAINLLPIWGNANSWSNLLGGVLVVAALFQAAFIYTMVIPYMRRPERALVASSAGLAIAGGLYLSIVIAVIGVFGAEETKKLQWPTLELAKTTTLPGNVLERLDAAFLALWVTAVFSTLFSTYYFTIFAIGKLFRMRDRNMLAPFLMPLLFAFAMVPTNVLHMYQIIGQVGRLGLYLTIGYPLFLLIVAKIRRIRGNSDDQGRVARPN